MRDRACNSVRGRKAKAAGNALEAFLEQQHEVALRLGILARVDKIDPPAVVRKGRVEFGERTGADYIGCLNAIEAVGEQEPVRDSTNLTVGFTFNLSYPARYCAIEAKSIGDARFYKGEVKSKQQGHLEQVSRAGGLALLVVEFRGEPDEEALSLMSHSPFIETGLLALQRGGARRYACPWQSVRWQVLRTAESVVEGTFLRDGWAMQGECYLEKFHPRGVPSSPVVMRQYARE